ncbi:hypothetical protein D3C76_944120 [compost metagenome]
MVERLDQDLVLVTFLEDVADRILGEGTGGDQALLGAFEGQIRGCWHESSPCRDEVKGHGAYDAVGPTPLTSYMPDSSEAPEY